jgi:hypothetical protein
MWMKNYLSVQDRPACQGSQSRPKRRVPKSIIYPGIIRRLLFETNGIM